MKTRKFKVRLLWTIIVVLVLGLIKRSIDLTATKTRSVQVEKIPIAKPFSTKVIARDNFTLKSKHSIATQTAHFQYQPPALPRPKTWRSSRGLGEFGVEAKLPNITKAEQQLNDEYGVNIALSKQISLHRILKDSRHQSCRDRKNFDYANLSSTSIIIVFYNEPLTLLLRTIYSVLHTTPDILLKEVILIDDNSSDEDLHQKLEKEVKGLQKVKIVRNKKREGLIRAKQHGVKIAAGEVIAFIDAHCECMKGWLEPLLEEIEKNPKTVAIPVTDDINSETFKYYYGSPTPSIGGFTWHLFFHWRSPPPLNNRNLSDPIPTPTMSGGLFAINRNWYLESGGYDIGMDVWGGENLEMSFRIWMCGGELKILPCSHVGHVSRNRLTYSRDSFWNNVIRVAEVWLDDYKHLFYHRLPRLMQPKNSVNVTERIGLRNKLNCHDFKWYLENIHPNQYVPDDITGRHGMLSPLANPRYCLDISQQGSQTNVVMYLCHGFGNQFFELNSQGELRSEFINEVCLVWNLLSSRFSLENCYDRSEKVNSNRTWSFVKNKLLMHNSSKKCLAFNLTKASGLIEMKACNESDKFQHWRWKSA